MDHLIYDVGARGLEIVHEHPNCLYNLGLGVEKVWYDLRIPWDFVLALPCYSDKVFSHSTTAPAWEHEPPSTATVADLLLNEQLELVTCSLVNLDRIVTARTYIDW